MLQHNKVLTRRGEQWCCYLRQTFVLFIWEVCGLFLSLEGTNAHSVPVKVSPQQWVCTD